MSSMLDILNNFNKATSGKKPAAPASAGSMKSILEGFDRVSKKVVDECGSMEMATPMSAPAAPQGQPVTVSITASGKENVDELMAILKGAGIEQHVDMPMAHDAHIDTDSHNVAGQEMDMATMRQIMAAGESDVEEEWANEPEEEYGSEDDVLAVGDDLHRPKDPKAIRAKDPAMESLADSLKASLRKALEEKMSKKKAVKTAEGERHGNSSMYDKCWDGYERVPGKKRGEKGSCRKK